MSKLSFSLLLALLLFSGCTSVNLDSNNYSSNPFHQPPKTTEQILAEFPNPPLSTKTLTIDKPGQDIVFTVEIADTEVTRTKGLMSRMVMLENQGMFFVFDKEAPLSFWMKNMKFPLDMIFLNKDMEIIDIIPYVQACKFDPCPTYSPKVSAQFVLEVNAGRSDVLGIAIGDKVQLAE